jgi:hypothetical protein
MPAGLSTLLMAGSRELPIEKLKLKKKNRAEHKKAVPKTRAGLFYKPCGAKENILRRRVTYSHKKGWLKRCFRPHTPLTSPPTVCLGC